jgi:hypothetical protein
VGTNSVWKRPLREVIPGRYYPLFLACVFAVTLVLTYIVLQPINHDDWIRTVQQIRYLWRGENPYCDPYCEGLTVDPDLALHGAYPGTIPYSPWYMFFFGVLYYATARLVVALNVAFWCVIILDSGRLPALALVLHPTFLMLWASANIDFLINGVGLWLILRGSRGWRRGMALMLIAIKPQVLPLVLVLEGVRTLWERDWEAVVTMTVMASISIALYPTWLTETLRTYFGALDGSGVATETRTLSGYSFSVFGAWGVLPAAAITAVVLVLMRRRLTEWRALTVLLGLVWTPYVNPYSFAMVLLLFRKESAWRVAVYLALSIAMLPVLFAEFHQYERYGTLVFLLLAAALTTPDHDQTEEAIAARHDVPIIPPAARLARIAAGEPVS